MKARKEERKIQKATRKHKKTIKDFKMLLKESDDLKTLEYKANETCIYLDE